MLATAKQNSYLRDNTITVDAKISDDFVVIWDVLSKINITLGVFQKCLRQEDKKYQSAIKQILSELSTM